MAGLPRLLLTMGDVAGIGPEIIARAWPDLLSFSVPVVIGDPGWMQRALELVGSRSRVVRAADAGPDPVTVPCLAATGADLSTVQPGRLSPAAGRAAYDFLCRAIDELLAGRGDAIVTAPLNKMALHAAGLPYPGHTEILAERARSASRAMLLYARQLAVAHVTLHLGLREALHQLCMDRILGTIRLLDQFLGGLLQRPARIGVAALNPHAGEGGIFGDEEERLIRPAVVEAQGEQIQASGPWPADTLFLRAHHGEFDGIVAMYHDQGHIPMKLLSGLHAVNVTVGLPFVRTSPAHGTAYDLAGRGMADATGFVEAARLAARIVRAREGRQ